MMHYLCTVISLVPSPLVAKRQQYSKEKSILQLSGMTDSFHSQLFGQLRSDCWVYKTMENTDNSEMFLGSCFVHTTV